MMNSKQQRRQRGVILTHQGLKKLQAAKSEAEICENNDKRYTLEALSFRTGLDPDTLMKVFARDTKVDKRTIKRCFSTFNLSLEPSDYYLPTSQLEKGKQPKSAITKVQQYWGLAPDVSMFFGRTAELTKLKHWIVDDRCRLVTLLGMAGMGKTYLSVKLAQEIQDDFEFIIWRSLRNPPPLKNLLAEFIQFLSKQQESELADALDRRILKLIEYLRSHRCLLILDNGESILGCSDHTGAYREGYESYSQLFTYVGEILHKSCLVLTTREKPQWRLSSQEGRSLPVRSIKLTGLNLTEAQQIFQEKGEFLGSPTEWRQLVEFYAGNPLMLSNISKTIQKLFEGNISEFLKQNTAIFGKIGNLLKQQFERLSDIQKEIINCVAINQHPLSFSELREQIEPSIPSQTLIEAVESLEERCLIEKTTTIEKKNTFFSLQPVVKGYVIEQLIPEQRNDISLRAFCEHQYQNITAVVGTTEPQKMSHHSLFNPFHV